jgi:hypothetical protein
MKMMFAPDSESHAQPVKTAAFSYWKRAVAIKQQPVKILLN